jgi:predicted house-cleaning noncanonical NTP pyrophosphatase (MazG superfamily)
MKIYNKLVRDKIPQIIEADGKSFKTRVLDDKEHFAELVKKLKEEIAEFETEPSVEELADLKELIIAIREAMGIHAGQLEDVRRQKAATNGRFKNKIFLESVED